MKKVVVVGGGTGTFTVLSGLKKFPVDLSAIVTVADSGGSTGRLRDQFGYLPPGDFRMALVALSSDTEEEQLLRQLFLYRFSQGEDGLKGHNFGNLFLTALTDILGSEQEALAYASRILRVKGTVLPVTTEDVELVASYSDGSILRGETYIDEPPEGHKMDARINDLWIEPNAVCTPQVSQALLSADMIILGPGDLYTSILANIVVRGVSQAINKSSASLAYIVNLMSKEGQTLGFTAEQHVQEVSRYVGRMPDYIFVNSTPFNEEALSHYQDEGEHVIIDDLSSEDYKIIQADLVSDQVFEKKSGDTLKRSLIRHDSDKLAWELMKVLKPF